ncbi:MAG: hypothetical protein IJZ82_07090 [Lachnospiraceae bacterium]|nr:hypothetical protein [Lachnospiraceae bacterium]
MIKKERVILMTKLASYEENEGRHASKISRYFRGDYVSVHLLKSWVCITVVYALLAGLSILYDLETFMENLYKMDYLAFAKELIKWYVIMAVAYLVAVYIAYSYRYMKARKSLKRYSQNLKKLGSMYHR